MNAALKNPPQPSSPRAEIDPAGLDAVLGRLESEHARLLELAGAHRHALSHASIEQMREITTKTSEVLIRIARIDQERQQMLGPEAATAGALDALLERLGPDDRAMLGQRRARLRELIERVKHEQLAVREASENLANHMRGLIKQVSASLSHAGTYSRAGAVDPSKSQVVSSLDMVR